MLRTLVRRRVLRRQVPAGRGGVRPALPALGALLQLAEIPRGAPLAHQPSDGGGDPLPPRGWPNLGGAAVQQKLLHSTRFEDPRIERCPVVSQLVKMLNLKWVVSNTTPPFQMVVYQLVCRSTYTCEWTQWTK